MPQWVKPFQALRARFQRQASNSLAQDVQHVEEHEAITVVNGRTTEIVGNFHGSTGEPSRIVDPYTTYETEAQHRANRAVKQNLKPGGLDGK